MNEEIVVLSPEEQKEQESRFGLKRAKSIDSGNMEPARDKIVSKVQPDNLAMAVVKIKARLANYETQLKRLQTNIKIQKEALKQLEKVKKILSEQPQ